MARKASEGSTKVIEAALRFARTNPALMDYARHHCRETNKSVDELLLEAIDRARCSAVAKRGRPRGPTFSRGRA